MMKTGIRAFTVGLFTLLALAALIFAYLWINHFRLKPDYSFYVVFMEPKYIRKGTEVIYRGIPVGKVANIKFSSDFDQTLMKININEEGLKLDKNTRVIIQELNFVGKKTVTLMPPDISSDQYVEDGETLVGLDSPGFVQMQIYANKLLMSMDSMFSNHENFQKIDHSLKNINQVINHYNCIADKFDHVLEQDKPAMKMFFGSPLKDFSCEI